ncbi:probable basic-leucine zipper transcription factor N isoform X2 [Lucilia sericata]|uniref:probable basic-leucine zipper transcription factor N isoform X2 n=1 Tax=Lucilia sericata TaxID=13632 RepID=UPI0018A872F1|nr:probable basic-leucine zipper transcription factor N isoform X2 [Lucilia sericata]
MVGGGNKIVATLRADGKVFPTKDGTTTIAQLANLMNYKIRTEGEIINNKSLSTLSVPTTVVDLGKQLLQYARDSDLKGVKNSLSRGAPFTSDWLGMSALHFAAMNNQLEICQVLLNGGINKDSKTKVDRTPLHLACYYGNEKIVELLLSKNCAVNPRDMLRMTPLHWAVEKRHKSIVRLLLKHNADVTLVTKFGRTPLALAVLTEQADLLEELETARQSQASRKFNEEHEKETSDAVNSIMGLTSDVIDEPESIRKIDEDEEFISQSEYAAAKIKDLENIKETVILGDSTINLLKSHGISMIPEDDTSKDMLNTALQNGRQLILSEGGKLLLSETKKIHNNTSSNNNNNNANNNNNLNSSKTVVPVRVRNDSSTYGNSTASNNSNSLSKLKPNIISKAKDNSNIAKNKNIRIISLNDFKKLYGNTNIKAMQKLPQTLSSQRLVNVRQQGQSKISQIKIDTKIDKITTTTSDELEEDENLAHIIQIETKSNDADISETRFQIQHVVQQQQQLTPQTQPILQQQPQQQQQTLIKQQPTVAKQPVRIVPAKRVEHMGTVQVRQQMPNTTTTHTIKANTSIGGANINTVNTANNTKSVGTQATANASSSVIPLLTTPEICRQLLELRKNNEELRRKFDLVQKEKEELRQRLERLEELLLVERTDDDS